MTKPGPSWPRRADGSFDVLLRVRVEQPEPLAVWLHQWARENRVWSRRWRLEDGVGNKTFDYDEEFFAPPSVETVERGESIVRLRVRPGSMWWRDWAVLRVATSIREDLGAEVLGVDFDPSPHALE